MNKAQDNQTTASLLKSFRETNQFVIDSFLTLQEHSLQAAQHIFDDWFSAFQNQGQSNQRLLKQMEQQMRAQQETVQKFVQEVTDASFELVRASASAYPSTVRLHETLRNCLYALTSRYPQHTLLINEEILGPQSEQRTDLTADDLIAHIQRTNPELLLMKARLEIAPYNKGIYLLECSEQVPALYIHCGRIWGRAPEYAGDTIPKPEHQTVPG